MPRPHLIQRLNDGLPHKLTLLSAPAGFGKTSLIVEWLANVERPTAWLSLDEGDNDPQRFWAYVVAALQTAEPELGSALLAALDSPQPPAPDALMTLLLNDLAALAQPLVLVLDDFHEVANSAVIEAVTFLLDHAPPTLHLVLTTRADPPLPLPRLRVRGALTELRASDLRFTAEEAAHFLHQTMGLTLSAENVAALEARTEGWIAGLQLAALALQGRSDSAEFIDAFSGSHRFVLDYLVEEVVARQPAEVQTFLLTTSVLDQLCGPLCDAVLQAESGTSQAMLAQLEQDNLFIIPLDNERRWYRYHHLFADLLRQRLATQTDAAALHGRASLWFEANGYQLEAFQQAAAADDVARAARLISAEDVPLYFKGAAVPVLTWLQSLPPATLDAQPALWVTLASVLAVVGQNAALGEVLTSAENALRDAPDSPERDDLFGQIALRWALLAAPRSDIDIMLAQSQRALDLLASDNVGDLTMAHWVQAYGLQLQGNATAARQAFETTMRSAEALGNGFVQLLAATNLGILQLNNAELHAAAESFRLAMALAGDPPQPAACEAALGLARIHYQWNDLPTARALGEQAVALAKQIDLIDSAEVASLFLAKLALAEGNSAEAEATLQRISARIDEPLMANARSPLVALWVRLLLTRGETEAARAWATRFETPLSLARVWAAQRAFDSAEALLSQALADSQGDGQRARELAVRVQWAVSAEMAQRRDEARAQLQAALALAEPSGIVRLFVDEGEPMRRLLAATMATDGRGQALLQQLQTALGTSAEVKTASAAQPLVDALTDRELEVLRLIAEGLTNRQIGDRLYLALDTVKGHNRRIFGKLQVQRRTEAVARARDLGLL